MYDYQRISLKLPTLERWKLWKCIKAELEGVQPKCKPRISEDQLANHLLDGFKGKNFVKQ